METSAGTQDLRDLVDHGATQTVGEETGSTVTFLIAIKMLGRESARSNRTFLSRQTGTKSVRTKEAAS